MAPARKRENRENRENQFYDVGVQGRKTGITLEDKGLRDEHGLEPISGIFSSPQKSPPKRAPSSRTVETVTESESMDIQESSIPDLVTSTHLLRTSRTRFPPPKARSPMKTALGSSPRRQSSMGPRRQVASPTSSPSRAVSHPAVSRRLDFEQDESSLQEIPALSGSGQPRGKRRSVYDIELSPSRGDSAVLEESIQDEIIATEDAELFDKFTEESFVADIGNENISGAEAEVSLEIEESEVIEAPKQPIKKGRKRKSEVMEQPTEAEEAAPKSRRQAVAAAKAPETQRKSKKATVAPATQPRRSKRVSDIVEEEPSIALDASGDVSELEDTSPVAARPRGRPPRAKAQPAKPAAAKEKPKTKRAAEHENREPAFKKPKTVAKPKKTVASKSSEIEQNKTVVEGGKLVDVHGKPISQSDLDQMSTTSVGSRFGRGRHLSVFRELDPDAVARVGRTGRHRVKPIDFWRNETIAYDPQGSMQAVVKNEDQEPVPRKYQNQKHKSKKRGLSAIDEEEEAELEPWEEEDGVFVGIFRDFDPVTEVTSNDLVETNIAWAEKGINPIDVADASFKFSKLASAGDESFLSWGFIELQPDQMKRTKNSRRMHMVFHIQSGAVEVKIHENVFTVHRGGVWQVPRGNTYSIRSVASGTSRIFFAQASEQRIQVEE